MRHRSVFSLPREIRWDAAAKQLVSRPVAELTRLYVYLVVVFSPDTRLTFVSFLYNGARGQGAV